MKNTQITLRVYGKERSREDGTKYTEYSYTPNGKKFVKVVFTKSCLTSPKETGYWFVTVNKEDLSIKQGKEKKSERGTYLENDKMFVKNVINVKKDEEYEKTREARRAEEINELLALDETLDKNLPF